MSDIGSAGSIRATIDFDAAGLEAAVNKAMAKASHTISSQIDTSMTGVESRIKSGFKRVGNSIVGAVGLADLTQAVIRTTGYIVNMGQKYEAQLNTFQAVSHASTAQMKMVSEAAKQLGNDIDLPGTSAADAAEAMTELAKAGFTVDESMAAAKGTLELAAAAQTTAGEAAGIASEQIQAFNLSAKDSGHVADVLANAANVSAADIGGMADSLKQSGAVANAAGISFEETAAAVALMANNSIQGSDAGTSLKSMLIALQAPSAKAAKLMQKYGIEVYDNQGKMKSLSGIIESVSVGLEGATDKQKQYALATIFGTDAVRAINVLMHEGADGLREMTHDLGEAGAAQKLAAANAQGLVGALGAVQNTLETVSLEIYESVAPALDKLIRDALPGFSSGLEDAIDYAGQLASALSPAAQIVGELLSAMKPGVVVAFKVALAALLGVVQTTAAVLGPVADLIHDNEAAFRAIVGPITAAYLAFKLFSKAATGVREFRTNEIAAFRGQVDKLKSSFKGATGVASRFRVVGGGLVGAMGGPWGVAIAAASVAIGVFAAKSAEAKAQADALGSTLDQQTGAITKDTKAWVANQLAKEGAYEKAKMLGISEGQLLNAALGVGNNLDVVNRVLKDHTFALNSSGSAADDHTGAEVEMSIAAQELDEVLNGTNGTIAERRGQIKAATTAMNLSRTADEKATVSKSRLDKVNRQLTGATDKTTRSMKQETNAAKSAKIAIDGLNDSSIKGINAQVDFEQAADDLRKQIKSLTPEVRNNGKALDVHTQAGRDTYRAMISLVQASAGVKGGMEKARKQIYNTIRPMVDSKAEAHRLTDQFFKLTDQANKIPPKKATRVSAPGVEHAINRVSHLRSIYAGLPPQVVTTIITNHVDKFEHMTSKATGGIIHGPGTATSDSIPARLSDGEYVIKAAAVQKYGVAMFDKLNAMRFADGGQVRHLAPARGQGPDGALVGQLSVSVGRKDELPNALDETLFHLRRIKRGGRYVTD